MNSSSETTPLAWTQRDLGGTVIAVLGLILSVLCWIDTERMVDADSFIFPRAVILVMGGLCLGLILRNLLLPGARPAPPLEGSPRRMILLVAIMLVTGVLVSVLGFMLSNLLAFAALMAVSQWERWSRRTLALYSVIGAAIVIGFYLTFKFALAVPLPPFPYL